MGLGPTQKQTIYGSYEFGIGVQHTNAELIEFVCLSCSRRSPELWILLIGALYVMHTHVRLHICPVKVVEGQMLDC